VACLSELAFDPVTNALIVVPSRRDGSSSMTVDVTRVQRCDSCGGMLVPPQITDFDPPKGARYVCLA
jgi:hypothetical protein